MVGLRTEKPAARSARSPAASAAGSTWRSAWSAAPSVLFLDEPTTGFDPEARRQFWELIRTMAAEGTTILLTTHYLDEAEALADRLAVIARGRIVAEGTPASLGGRATARATVQLGRRHRAHRRPDPADPAPGRGRRRPEHADHHPPDPRGHLPLADRRRTDDHRRAAVHLQPPGFSRGRVEMLQFVRDRTALIFTFAFPATPAPAVRHDLRPTTQPGVSASQIFSASMIAYGIVTTAFITMGAGHRDGPRGRDPQAASRHAGDRGRVLPRQVVFVVVASLAEVVRAARRRAAVLRPAAARRSGRWFTFGWLFVLSVIALHAARHRGQRAGPQRAYGRRDPERPGRRAAVHLGRLHQPDHPAAGLDDHASRRSSR